MFVLRASLQLRPAGTSASTFLSWASGREKVQSHGARLMSNLC